MANSSLGSTHVFRWCFERSNHCHTVDRIGLVQLFVRFFALVAGVTCVSNRTFHPPARHVSFRASNGRVPRLHHVERTVARRGTWTAASQLSMETILDLPREGTSSTYLPHLLSTCTCHTRLRHPCESTVKQGCEFVVNRGGSDPVDSDVSPGDFVRFGSDVFQHVTHLGASMRATSSSSHAYVCATTCVRVRRRVRAISSFHPPCRIRVSSPPPARSFTTETVWTTQRRAGATNRSSPGSQGRHK